ETFSTHRARPFLINGGPGSSDEVLTYGAVENAALALAGRLREAGVPRGEPLVVLLDNSVETALVYFGALFRGCPVIPINPILTKYDVSYIVQHARARTVITQRTYRDHFEPQLVSHIGPRFWMIDD